jgi:hypothetical protein
MAQDQTKIVIEGHEIEVVENLMRRTHKDGVAGFYAVRSGQSIFEVWGIWDNEHEKQITPFLFEKVKVHGEHSDPRSNEPGISATLIEGTDEQEDLTCEDVARELTALLYDDN